MTDTLYTSPTERVQVWAEGSTLHIRFNNPGRHNALSVDMWEAVPEIIAAFDADPEIRVIALTGAGDRAFVAGADISQFGESRSTAEGILA